jgi:hypothetical protein
LLSLGKSNHLMSWTAHRHSSLHALGSLTKFTCSLGHNRVASSRLQWVPPPWKRSSDQVSLHTDRTSTSHMQHANHQSTRHSRQNTYHFTARNAFSSNVHHESGRGINILHDTPPTNSTSIPQASLNRKNGCLSIVDRLREPWAPDHTSNPQRGSSPHRRILLVATFGDEFASFVAIDSPC